MPIVVDISSSPEPEPARMPSRGAKNAAGSSKTRQTRARLRDASIDVIEIFDSDSDAPVSRVKSPSKKRATGQGEAGPSTRSRQKTPQVRAGPSRVTGQAVDVLLTPNGDRAANDPLAGAPPPRHGKGKARVFQDPLFLPSDEENEFPALPRDPSWSPVRAAPPHDDPFLEGPPAPEAPMEPAPPLRPKSPTPPPAADANPIDTFLARILEIVPDVQPGHALTLIERHLPAENQEQVVETVLHILFEDPKYPKIDKKGKRKREEGEGDAGAERGTPKSKIDYASMNRPFVGGAQYVDIAIEQLLVDYPYIPKAHIRKTFFANNSLYAPTYIFLEEEKKNGPATYVTKTQPSRVTGKGKAMSDPEFDKERQWLLLKQQEATIKADEAAAEELNEQEYEECGDGIECGCCFSTYPFDKMVQCPDAHLFCTTCMTTYASTLLGSHDANIVCMDQSGCKLPFPESELQRFLSEKLMALYERVKQRKEIEAAGLEGLEECPFCEYKCVIENPDEKLFRCENSECGAVTCRECKKPDHVPKSCKEMEEDKHLDARHAIEEAMTRALMRNCPKCNKAFVKEHGCNKMTCPNCHTVSCYICRKVINGYEHFANPPPYNRAPDPSKCVLWDNGGNPEARHADEVNEAAKKALEEYKRDHPDVDEKDIKIDLPPAPAAPVAGPAYPHVLPARVPAPLNDPFHVGRQAALQRFIERREPDMARQVEFHRQIQERQAEVRVQMMMNRNALAQGPAAPLNVHVRVGGRRKRR
ncbi:hypothetical protein PLICRDRAFT_176699 [Plicaturopsis crispa FD-325 SS-3]|nr:hypothetical protein PLICRDRAFT_176699 [Plicaturopsis crispa FD-325 SS-3]